MIDDVDRESEKLSGRTQAHAPEVDGVVVIEGGNALHEAANFPGDMIDVKITGALDYDLIGEKLHA
jgi:tRNA A37 methylthiotransferase MiaB